MVVATAQHRTVHSAPDQGGFALIVLLSIIGIGSVGILLAVQASLPVLSVRHAVATDNVATVAKAATVAYRQSGTFPANLNALATAAGLPSSGQWRRDPFGSAQELDYVVRANDVRVRSRGPDGVLGTADDEQRVVSTETQLRARQRLRLRMLRAVLLRSPFRLAAGMSESEELQMKSAMNSYATAKRRWLTADAAERTVLTATMVSASVIVNSLVATHTMPSLPVALTGAGGLMSQLGMSDGRCVDGRGAALTSDAIVGWIAAGVTGGIDDDM